MNRRLSPEYWQGYDICAPEQFTDGQLPPGGYLGRKEYNQARNDLHFALGKVAAGNATEIRSRGDEFATELGAGTLVVIDTERLTKWWYAGERSWKGYPSKASPPITRPYSDYWLSHQDKTEKPQIEVGSQTETFVEQQAKYDRLLDWGVLAAVDTKAGKEMYIQPFSFSVTKLLPDGTIHSLPYSRKYPFFGRALKMPVRIGEVTEGGWLELQSCAINSLSRIRSIDIVYPVAAKPEKAPEGVKSILQRLGKLRLGWNLA